MKINYKITFVHKVLCIILLILAGLFFCQPQSYRNEFEYGKQGTIFPFLQKGEYVLYISYNAAPSENSIIIYSDNLIDDKNHMGVELMCVNVGKTAGMQEVMLSLEQDVVGVQLKTSQDTEEITYITYVALQSIQLQNRDNYLLGLLCVFGAVLTIILGWYVPTEKYKIPAVLVLLGLAASMPLFSDFLLDGHDLSFHIARIEAIYRGLRAGEFPVYLGSNQMGGFGMLSATMYPDLFLYPIAILRFFKISLMLCYKLLLVCMHIGTAFISYYSIKSICKSDKIALVASVFYTFSIYRLTNIYLRAALGECLSMVFLPLIIWGIYEILWGNYKKWYLLTLGMGGVLQSHVLSTEMCVLFLILEVVVWLMCRKGNFYVKRILAGMKAAGLTILLNAFFLVPFLFFCGEELQCFYIPNKLSDTTLYFSQMFSMFPQGQGVDIQHGNTIGEMPHTLGPVLLLGALLLSVEIFREKENCIEMQVGKRCLLYGILAVLMSSWLFPWEIIQNNEIMHDIVAVLQFAWRFQSFASVFLSIAAAVGVVHFVEHATNKNWVYGVCAVLVICSAGYFFDMKGLVSTQYNDKMTFNNYGTTDALYMYLGGNDTNYKYSDAYIVTQNGTQVEYTEYEREGMQLKVKADIPNGVDDYLLFPFYYYPGYEIMIDGESVEVLSLDTRVACKMPEGSVNIEVYYKGMPEFSVANWVSIFALCSVLGYSIVIFAKKAKAMKN